MLLAGTRENRTAFCPMRMLSTHTKAFRRQGYWHYCQALGKPSDFWTRALSAWGTSQAQESAGITSGGPY